MKHGYCWGTDTAPVLLYVYPSVSRYFFSIKRISGIFFGKKKKHKIEVKQLAMPIGQRIIGGSSGYSQMR
jgi:hypothetical protein